MPRLLALDLGDAWTGIAISDPTGTLAKPYTTVPARELTKALTTILPEFQVATIVVGYPKTMKGTVSEQTRIVEKLFALLQKTFPTYQWVVWDERLSSKRASAVQKEQGGKNFQEQRLKGHAIAAAFVLDSYITFLHAQQINTQEPRD